MPDPTYGSIGSTADLVAAVDAAVSDGMDVINLSIGGTEIDPRSDALVRAVQGAVRAGVVVVIAAGNERADARLRVDRLAGSRERRDHGCRDQLVALLRAASVDRGLDRRARGAAARSEWPRPTPGAVPARSPARIVVAASGGDNGRLCRRRRGQTLDGSIALVERGGCSVIQKASVAHAEGAKAVLIPPLGAGPPESEIDQTEVPVLVAPAPVVDALQAYLATGAAARLTVGAATREEPTLPGVVASFSSAGPTPFDQRLKPDVAAPGINILSSVPDSSSNEPNDWAVFDGTSMSTPVVAGAAALLLQAHPDWTPADVKESLMATAHPAFVDEAGTREASPLAAGAGLVDVAAADAPGIVAEPPSLTFGAIPDGGTVSLDLAVRDLGGGAGDWAVSVRTRRRRAGGGRRVRAAGRHGAGGRDGDHRRAGRRRPGRRAGKEASGIVELVQGARVRRVPFWLRVDRPILATKKVRPLTTARTYHGRHARSRQQRDLLPLSDRRLAARSAAQVLRPGPAVALPPPRGRGERRASRSRPIPESWPIRSC